MGYGLLCTEQLQKVAWAEHSQCFFLLPLKIRKKILPGRAAQIFLIKIFKILALAKLPLAQHNRQGVGEGVRVHGKTHLS